MTATLTRPRIRHRAPSLWRRLTGRTGPQTWTTEGASVLDGLMGRKRGFEEPPETAPPGRHHADHPDAIGTDGQRGPSTDTMTLPRVVIDTDDAEGGDQ